MSERLLSVWYLYPRLTTVPELVINLNFTLTNESLNFITVTIKWKVSLILLKLYNCKYVVTFYCPSIIKPLNINNNMES